MNSIQKAQYFLDEFKQEEKRFKDLLGLMEQRRLMALAHLKVIVDECSSAAPDVVKILRTALKAANELEG